MTIKLYKGSELIAKNEGTNKSWVHRYANRIIKDLGLRVARELKNEAGRYIYAQNQTGFWFQIAIEY